MLGRLESYAALPCMVCDGVTSSYAELLAGIARFRIRLDALELPPGAVVGVRADFSLDAAALLLALIDRRLVAALLPREMRVETAVADCGAVGWFALGERGDVTWRKAAGGPRHRLVESLVAQRDAGLALFSSGTSGRSKVALHSAGKFLGKYARPGRRFRTLAFLLFDHVAGLDTLFYTLFSGGTLVVTRQRDVHSICRLIDEQAVEVLPASPSFLRLLSLAPPEGEQSLASLRIITYGSEPMDAHTLAALNVRFPSVQIIQKYGTTETGSPRSESRGNDSLWLRFKADGVQVRIVDGVLWLRGGSTFLGYLNSDPAIDADGWYCTGDLVEVDGDWLHILGRASGLINVGGEKVSPEEVERVILELDFVAAAVVAGESNPLMGQIVTAEIALRPGANQKDAARVIRDHCRRLLPPYKVPVKIAFADAALITSRQKLRRAAAGP